MRAVIKRRGAAAAKVSEDDVLRAIEKLRVLGGGWSALNVGGRVVVRSGSFVRSFIRSFIHSLTHCSIPLFCSSGSVSSKSCCSGMLMAFRADAMACAVTDEC